MVAISRSKKVRRNVLKINKVICTVLEMSFRGKAVSWKDSFELKRYVTAFATTRQRISRGKKDFSNWISLSFERKFEIGCFEHFSEVKSISVRSTSIPTAKCCHMFYYETNIWHFSGKNVMKWVFCFQDDSDWLYSDLSVQLNNYISQWKQHTNCCASTGNFFSSTCHPKANLFSAGWPSRFPADPSVNFDWSIFGGVEEIRETRKYSMGM